MTPKSRISSSTSTWKIIPFAALVVILAAAGGFAYSTSLAIRNQGETVLQTEMVRRGDLVMSASGSGTLIPQRDARFGFDASGQVTGIYTKIGDQVEAGQVLAQLDDTLAQMEVVEAEQALLELSSAASIAAIQQEIGAAQDAEYYAREWLEYLLSEEVVEAEENLAITEQKLAQAQAEAKAKPSNAAAQTVKDQEQAVTFLREKLDQAWAYYENEYLPENFAAYETVGSGRRARQVVVTYVDPYTGEARIEINPPSVDDIAIARNNLAQAQETIRESEIYLEALETGVIPEGATGGRLTTLYEAQRALEAAKAALDDRQLIAPISGTVTALDLSIGEQVDKNSSSSTSSETGASFGAIIMGEQTNAATFSIITISQLNQPYTLDIYLDEAGWNMAQVGNKVNVTFDLLDGQTFPGIITLLYPELNESFEASLVHIVVQLDQRISQDLPAGTGANVEVIGEEARGVVLVPVDTLHNTDDGKFVVMILQNGQQVEREVEIGLQNDAYAEVKSGLEPGEIVVTE